MNRSRRIRRMLKAKAYRSTIYKKHKIQNKTLQTIHTIELYKPSLTEHRNLSCLKEGQRHTESILWRTEFHEKNAIYEKRKSIRVNGQLFTLQREGVGSCRRIGKWKTIGKGQRDVTMQYIIDGNYCEIFASCRKRLPMELTTTFTRQHHVWLWQLYLATTTHPTNSAIL